MPFEIGDLEIDEFPTLRMAPCSLRYPCTECWIYVKGMSVGESEGYLPRPSSNSTFFLAQPKQKRWEFNVFEQKVVSSRDSSVLQQAQPSTEARGYHTICLGRGSGRLQAQLKHVPTREGWDDFDYQSDYCVSYGSAVLRLEQRSS